MQRRPHAVFFFVVAGVLGAGLMLLLLAGVAGAIPTGDTLSVIQRPLVNIPYIVTEGSTMRIDCEASPGTSGWAAELIYESVSVSMTVLSATYNSSTEWWEVDVQIPVVPVHELYDLRVTASGGIDDTTWDAVRVISAFKNDYYFVHITDTHLCSHLYNYEPGWSTDSSEVEDLRAVIDDINLINPEFVVITGDFINEGELEEYLDAKYYSRAQALLREFKVPVYLTSGNHDIGGWDDTPPPDGNARRNWWRFFGWKRLDSPPAGAPWFTQNYSFNYGPVHYIGLEAYLNYDNWRPGTYGSESFTSGQMQWLDDDIAAASGSSAHVLFYHSDFGGQINLNSLGADMALYGHSHSDRDDWSHPYYVRTDNVCDGARAYRLIRVSGGSIQPTSTVHAGGDGNNLYVDYFPGNNGTYYVVRADVTNDINEDFEHSLIRFVMPNEPGTVNVAGGTLVQVDTSGPYAVYYVAADIPANSSPSVVVHLTPGLSDPPVVTVNQPDGSETWLMDSFHDITWTATDDVGVTSIDILLSTDGGGSYGQTIATGETNDGTYSWLVDVAPTTQARVKVIAYDADANEGEDVSDGNFTVADGEAPVVTVVRPDGTEVWSMDSSYNILWTATDNVGVTSVDILLSSDGGATYPHSIATGEANDGTYSWLVDAAPTAEARVKVVAHDAAANSAEDASDSGFTIADVEAPVVTVIQPDGGETWNNGSSYDILWMATDNVDAVSVDILLSTDGGATYPQVIKIWEANDGVYSWQVDEAPTTQARVKVIAYDAAANRGEDASDSDFTIADGEAPEVTVIQPNGGESWAVDSVFDVTWSATDDIGVTSVDILLSSDGGGTYPHTIASGETNDGTYSWLVDVALTTQARVKVVAHDAAANSGEDASDADFEIYDPTSGIAGEGGIPAGVVISGAVPNPFSTRTLIRFGLPRDGRIEADIYDVSGRLVARIAEGEYGAGHHEVAWSAGDGSVKPGIYFVRLRMGSEVATHRLVMMR